jgi:hypothetical protein
MQWGNRDMDEMRNRYPAGMRLELLCMNGEPQMPRGLRGTVKYVDDAGHIHCSWDNGSGLALVPGEDSFRTLTSEEIADETLDEQKGGLTIQ